MMALCRTLVWLEARCKAGPPSLRSRPRKTDSDGSRRWDRTVYHSVSQNPRGRDSDKPCRIEHRQDVFVRANREPLRLSEFRVLQCFPHLLKEVRAACGVVIERSA